MEQPVEGVEQNLALRAGAKRRRLVLRHRGTNHDLPVGKSDHVGLSRVAQKIAVHPGDGRAIDENEGNFTEAGGQRPGKQGQRALKLPPKSTNWQANLVLSIGQPYSHSFFPS